MSHLSSLSIWNFKQLHKAPHNVNLDTVKYYGQFLFMNGRILSNRTVIMQMGSLFCVLHMELLPGFLSVSLSIGIKWDRLSLPHLQRWTAWEFMTNYLMNPRTRFEDEQIIHLQMFPSQMRQVWVLKWVDGGISLENDQNRVSLVPGLLSTWLVPVYW